MSSFVDTPKNEIPGAALELPQVKIKQFSAGILKFSTKHEDNPFTLNCYMVPCTFSFIFDAGSRRLGSNNFRSSSYKGKTAGSARVSVSYDYGWTAAFDNHVYLNSIEQFTEFQSDDVIKNSEEHFENNFCPIE